MPDNTTPPATGTPASSLFKSPQGMQQPGMPGMAGWMPFMGMGQNPMANKKAPQQMEEPARPPLAPPMTGPNGSYSPPDPAARANLLATMIRRARGGGNTGGT